MSERENGWYLRSEGYMTSEYSYQRIEAMKGNRALDNHQKLVFVKFMGGEEKDSRVYVPHPGTCKLVTSEHDYDSLYYHEFSCGHDIETDNEAPPIYCPECGAKVVKR